MSEKMDPNLSFKERYSLNKRKQLSKEAQTKYENKYALIIEKTNKSKDKLVKVANPKFLIPKTFTIGQVSQIVRQKLNLTKEQALFLLVNEGKTVLR